MTRVHGAFTPAHDPATDEAPKEQATLNDAIRSALGRGRVDTNEDRPFANMSTAISRGRSTQRWTVVEPTPGAAA